MLNVFEVTLRNAINEQYKAYFNDPDWIRTQIAPGGMLSQHPQKSIVEKTIVDLTASGRYTNDRVVSSVTFGFWTYLFTKKPFRLGGQNLLKIFPQKAIGLGQRAIYNELMAIKDFRNRIAYHEPICFDGNGCKSIKPALANYNLIVRYVNFLGYPEGHLFFGLDVMPDSILERIDCLITRLVSGEGLVEG